MLIRKLKFIGSLVLFLLYGVSLFQLHQDYNQVLPATALVQHSGKYFIFVDCVESKLYLFQNGELIKTYNCAGGKPSTPSPIGTWTIVSKGRWAEGFGGSWMGFNVPWGKFGIHGNNDPQRNIGWPSSMGCIRMKNDEVRELYNMVPIGTKVQIEDGPFGDFGRGFRLLSSGQYGSDVKQVQMALKKQGYYHGAAHGYFDQGTLNSVKKFQKDHQMAVQDRIYHGFYEKLGLFLFQ